MKKLYFALSLILISTLALAQVPANYYNSANGLTGYSLKTELRNITTSGHTPRSYDQLFDGAGISGSQGYIDTHSDVSVSSGQNYENDGSILDMYSENPEDNDTNPLNATPYNDPYLYNHGLKQCGNQSAEGDCYNREHLVPSSSWGSSESTPMFTDIHHVIPTDGRVNNFRGTLPFGKVVEPNPTDFTSLNGSKRGPSDTVGFSGTMFEPIDEFKGDIARALLYFATRYQNNVDTYNFDMFNGTENQAFEDWAIAILLDWHNNVDPVDQRERERNDAAYNFQGNANPFVDHPEYANLIWNPTPDNIDPTTPTNLIASNPTASTVDLAWTASTDNIGVVTYDVYVNGTFYVTTNSITTTYTVTGLNPETTYVFTLLAKDAAGNMSMQSNSVNETTIAGPPTGTDCVSETFETIPNNGSSYSSFSWTGIDGITNGWNATDSRTDQTITAKAVTVRNGTLTSPSIAGGIGELTVTTKRVFSGGSGTFTLRVNGSAVGTVAYSDVEQNITISNINIEGNVSISFTDKASTSDRVSIDNLSWTCYSAPSDLKLSAKVYLQGPAINRSAVIGEENWMRDDLRVNNLIPTTSPYDVTTCDASIFNTTGANAIVDWVLVQLRDANNNTSIIESQSALLQRDGNIVAIDGVSELSFSSPPTDYFITVKHRNHLGIMTIGAVTLSNTILVVDFTDNSTPITNGTDAQTSFGMPNGILAMWAGDSNSDGRLNYSGALSDVPGIRSQVFNDPNNSVFGGPPVASYPSSGYNSTDIDMDGVTVYSGASSDVLHVRNNIFNNPSNSVFGGPPTSTYVFIQQLPEGAN
ncbi:endonuclease [uncultured Lacinutrix sp.]|uniref:endonuclease n=1 Tax=uncultured Lacinutrix sp. TaxID=574032 RepID=UPI002635410D|nr:endonuclease [uncultured Lacinutrix sp.]